MSQHHLFQHDAFILHHVVKKIKLYREDFYILDFVHLFPIFEISASLTLAFLMNQLLRAGAETYRVKILCVSHNGKAKTVSPHDILRCLGCSEQIQPSLQRISLEESQHQILEKKDEGNISERGCAKNHSGRVLE